MRREFPAKIKESAWDRCGGLCEVKGCRAPIKPGRARFDHLIPDGLGGEPTLQNCQVMCIPCHDDKTHKRDVPAIAKTKRIARRHKGIRKTSKFPCSRDSAWKKKVGGEVVRR